MFQEATAFLFYIKAPIPVQRPENYQRTTSFILPSSRLVPNMEPGTVINPAFSVLPHYSQRPDRRRLQCLLSCQSRRDIKQRTVSPLQPSMQYKKKRKRKPACIISFQLLSELRRQLSLTAARPLCYNRLIKAHN